MSIFVCLSSLLLFFILFVCLSVCLCVCLCVCLSILATIYLFINSSICLFFYLPVRVSIFLSCDLLSLYLSICISSLYPTFFLSIYFVFFFISLLITLFTYLSLTSYFSIILWFSDLCRTQAASSGLSEMRKPGIYSPRLQPSNPSGYIGLTTVFYYINYFLILYSLVLYCW